jgi:hypothetical protein
MVTDAATEINIFEDLFKLYTMRKKGEPFQLQASPHYSDFVADSEQHLTINGVFLQIETYTEKLQNLTHKKIQLLLFIDIQITLQQVHHLHCLYVISF